MVRCQARLLPPCTIPDSAWLARILRVLSGSSVSLRPAAVLASLWLATPDRNYGLCRYYLPFDRTPECAKFTQDARKPHSSGFAEAMNKLPVNICLTAALPQMMSNGVFTVITVIWPSDPFPHSRGPNPRADGNQALPPPMRWHTGISRGVFPHCASALGGAALNACWPRSVRRPLTESKPTRSKWRSMPGMATLSS